MKYIALDIGDVLCHVESEPFLDLVSETFNATIPESARFLKRFQQIHDLGYTTMEDELKDKYKDKKELKKKAKELNTDYRLLEKKKHPLGWLIAGMIGIVLTFPLFIYGNIFNLTFLEIPNLQIRKIKDPQFHSSIRYGISLALAFVFLPAYLIISLFVFSSWWLGLLIFFTLPLSGLFAWNYYLQFHRMIGGFRIRNLIKQHNDDFMLLRKNHSELVNLIAQL